MKKISICKKFVVACVDCGDSIASTRFDCVLKKDHVTQHQSYDGTVWSYGEEAE